MPIEFRCPNCQSLLCVPDGTEGRSSKCPQCGGIAQIPPGFFPPPPPEAGGQPGPPAVGPGEMNPYAPPLAPAMAHAGIGPLGSGRLSAGEALHTAWVIFQRQLGPAVVAMLVLFMVAIVSNGVANAFVAPALHPQAPPGAKLALAVVTPLLTLLGAFLDQCRKQFYLRLARGDNVTIGELFQMRTAYWPYLGAFVIFGLVFSAGAALCLIPALIVYLYLGQFGRLLIEKRAGALESFSLSARITEGNRSEQFLLILAGFGIGLLGLLACGIGLLFAISLVELTFAVAYLRMTGQRTAIDG